MKLSFIVFMLMIISVSNAIFSDYFRRPTHRQVRDHGHMLTSRPIDFSSTVTDEPTAQMWLLLLQKQHARQARQVSTSMRQLTGFSLQQLNETVMNEYEDAALQIERDLSRPGQNHLFAVHSEGYKALAATWYSMAYLNRHFYQSEGELAKFLLMHGATIAQTTEFMTIFINSHFKTKGTQSIVKILQPFLAEYKGVEIEDVVGIFFSTYMLVDTRPLLSTIVMDTFLRNGANSRAFAAMILGIMKRLDERLTYAENNLKRDPTGPLMVLLQWYEDEQYDENPGFFFSDTVEALQEIK